MPKGTIQFNCYWEWIKGKPFTYRASSYNAQQSHKSYFSYEAEYGSVVGMPI